MPVSYIDKKILAKYKKEHCGRCGSQQSLDLHHLDGNRTNNWLENLLTLCDSCHTRLHWETGKIPWRRHDISCLVCDKPSRHSGLCATHRSRLRRNGSPFLVKRRAGLSVLLVVVPGLKNGQECREWPLESK